MGTINPLGENIDAAEAFGHEIRFYVEARSFLHHQVRNMVGTLVKIGAGKWPVTRVSEILTAQNRDLAGPTAPAHGLCLMEVRYDDEENA